MNWKWPAKPGNSYLPWYVIGWRAPWWLIYKVLGLLLVLVVSMAHGPRAGRRLWDDIG